MVTCNSPVKCQQQCNPNRHHSTRNGRSVVSRLYRGAPPGL